MSNKSLLKSLRQAHEAALANLEILQGLVDDLSAGDVGSGKERLRQVLPFFEEELLLHFRQEEEILFPVLQRFIAGPGPVLLDGEEPELCSFLFCDGLCRRIGPLAMYRRDHQTLHQCIGSLKSLSKQLDEWTTIGASQVAQIEQDIRLVQWHFASHIAKENEVLFPKAEEVLSPALLALMRKAAKQLSSAKAPVKNKLRN